jgi:hypothetical protein
MWLQIPPTLSAHQLPQKESGGKLCGSRSRQQSADIIRANEIAIENSKTGKVNAVIAILKVFGDKFTNSRSAKHWFEFRILQKMYHSLRYFHTFAPIISASVSQLTSLRLIMVAGGISPYHHLWTDDNPIKRLVGTPTSGGIIGVVGLVVTKPKPPIFQCYLHTACVKVFFSSAATHGLS